MSGAAGGGGGGILGTSTDDPQPPSNREKVRTFIIYCNCNFIVHVSGYFPGSIDEEPDIFLEAAFS